MSDYGLVVTNKKGVDLLITPQTEETPTVATMALLFESVVTNNPESFSLPCQAVSATNPTKVIRLTESIPKDMTRGMDLSEVISFATFLATRTVEDSPRMRSSLTWELVAIVPITETGTTTYRMFDPPIPVPRDFVAQIS